VRFTQALDEGRSASITTTRCGAGREGLRPAVTVARIHLLRAQLAAIPFKPALAGGPRTEPRPTSPQTPARRYLLQAPISAMNCRLGWS